MTNPNLALALIRTKLEDDTDFDPNRDTDLDYSAEELERLEAYGVIAEATVYLRCGEGFQELTVSASVWGVTVFDDDRSYLETVAKEQVEIVTGDLQRLGVELPANLQDFVTDADEDEECPTPAAAFSAIGQDVLGNSKSTERGASLARRVLKP